MAPSATGKHPRGGGAMSQHNDSWNQKWQAQMDMAHAELLELLGQKRAHEQAQEEIRQELALMDLRLEVQLALMELINSQIKPPG